MRVLYNGLQAGNRSGTGRYTVELLRAMAELDDGLEITAVWPDDVERPALSERVRYIVGSGKGLRRLWFDQVGMGRLAREADVVHYPASVGPLRGMPGLVLTVHDLAFLRHPEWFSASRAHYYRFAVGRSARRAVHVIADSQATADDLNSLLGIPEDRISVAHLGVGHGFVPCPGKAGRVHARYRLPERFLLYLGTLEPRKNLVRLVEAYGRVADQLEQDLVLAGRMGWRNEQLEAALAASPCRDRIHLPGYISEADQPALLSAADAFCWPSLYEGFGLPPLEAMACGTPVLTSNTSSLPEVVGDAALTVDPTDTEAIAGGILRLGHDSAYRGGLRERGLARARGFTWRRCAEAVREAYRRAAE